MAGTTNITRGLFGERLSKRLPRMVDWFDPVLLGLVGIRTLISTTIGQYADQRPIQAAMDREDNRTTLALRHDFTGARAKRQGRGAVGRFHRRPRRRVRGDL